LAQQRAGARAHAPADDALTPRPRRAGREAESEPSQTCTASYRLVPDKAVAGAEKPVSILWNGPKAHNLAYVMQVVTRASSGDQIIALYARNRARADAGSSYAPMRV
jgi:hypothetical protein